MQNILTKMQYHRRQQPVRFMPPKPRPDGAEHGGGGPRPHFNHENRYKPYDERPPPPAYVCFRCGQKGHYISNCPTNGNKEFDKPRIKRTTGIPRSFLKAVEKNDAALQTNQSVMVTPEGGLVVAVADE